MDLLPEKFKVVTATTDDRAGEHGTIYQACGFVPVKMNTHTRSQIEVGGKLIGSRNLRSTLGGKSSKADIKARCGESVKIVKETQKLRWFAFRGTHKQKRRSLEAVSHLLVKHPKRAEEVSKETRAGSTSEGGGRFPDSALICVCAGLKREALWHYYGGICPIHKV